MKPYIFFKTSAKINLGRNFIKFIVAFLFVSLLPSLILLLPSSLNLSKIHTLILLILSTFILIPCFKIGAIGFMIDSMEKKETSLGNMFDGFLYIFKLIPLILSKIISYIPLMLVIFLAYKLISKEAMDILREYALDPAKNIDILVKIPQSDFYTMFFTELGVVVSIILSIIINAYVSLTNYILYSEKLSGIKAVIKSIKLMKGHILYYIGFNLSFFIWYIVSAFTQGFSDTIFIPYKEASFIMFYKFLNGEFPDKTIAQTDYDIKEEE